MSIDLNNVLVTHKGITVSIAQHTRDLNMPNLHGSVTTMREIAICHPDRETGENLSIYFYGKSLDSLINRLIEVRDEIDKIEIREPSSKGDATGTQVTASSTAQKGQ